MIKLPNENTIYFDIDDTLIKWNADISDINNTVLIKDNNGFIIFGIHKVHIEKLIEHKNNGAVIVAWSQQGSEWVETVIKALKLEAYVDIAIKKPDMVYDDTNYSYWMPKITWLNDDQS